jgi:glucosamine-6-phosphate deaminase
LTERTHLALENSATLSHFDKMHFLTDLALQCNKKIADLKKQDLRTARSGDLFLQKMDENFTDLIKKIEKEYVNRIDKALEPVKNEVFLHTAPHHDDIMLGYLPYLFRLFREQSNAHFFNYLTSGFNAVTNTYMLKQSRTAMRFLNTPEFQALVKTNYFQPDSIIFKNRDVYQYLDGLAANDRYAMDEGAARRFLRNLKYIYNLEVAEHYTQKLEFLSNYFVSQYPGQKDIPDIQRLKGMIREWEADIEWGYFGFGANSVIHSRLGFYKGDIFTEEPEINRDIVPIIETLKKVNPTIITVALDPEGSGPDTHYK